MAGNLTRISLNHFGPKSRMYVDFSQSIFVSYSNAFQVSLKDLYKLDELAEAKGFTDLTDDSDPKKKI